MSNTATNNLYFRGVNLMGGQSPEDVIITDPVLAAIYPTDTIEVINYMRRVFSMSTKRCIGAVDDFCKVKFFKAGVLIASGQAVITSIRGITRMRFLVPPTIIQGN